VEDEFEDIARERQDGPDDGTATGGRTSYSGLDENRDAEKR